MNQASIHTKKNTPVFDCRCWSPFAARPAGGFQDMDTPTDWCAASNQGRNLADDIGIPKTHSVPKKWPWRQIDPRCGGECS